jgi:hypothetical protein
MGEESLLSEISDSIIGFAKKRHYIIEERSDEIDRIFTIYERKPDSHFSNMMAQAFGGSLMIDDRIRIIVKLKKIGEDLESEVTGDVLLSDWELVNDRPKRKDVLKLKVALEEIIDLLKLQGVKVNSPRMPL